MPTRVKRSPHSNHDKLLIVVDTQVHVRQNLRTKFMYKLLQLLSHLNGVITHFRKLPYKSVDIAAINRLK